MKAFFILYCFCVVNAYHLTSSKDNALNSESAGDEDDWMHMPIERDSEEYEWADDITLVPSQTKQPSSDIYQWIEDDVVHKARPKPENEKIVELPGGCELTKTQFQRLKDFRKDVSYVQKCYCQEGSVYCKLKKGGDHVQIT